MVEASIFEKELDWLHGVIDLRFRLYFDTGQTAGQDSVYDLKPPRLAASAYADTVRMFRLGFRERLAVALCLAVHLRPQMLDVFFTQNQTFNRPFTEFGGLSPGDRSGFLPTGETLLFLLAGADITERLEALSSLSPEKALFRKGILELAPPVDGRPRQTGLLRLTHEYESRLLLGRSFQPEFSVHFPASRLTSELNWEDDLVLPPGTKKQLKEIRLWMESRDRLLGGWGLGKRLRPGYRSLFYGPPGTGKTFTASLLGKETDRDVYRIDLSLVVSKYIGETEKNLAKVFNAALHKKWILFFDEADALFGKRTQVQSAHDRYANQEISFLLQRLESFDGITILATNLRGNIDEAFTRRFDSIIYFPLPGPEQRFQLWKNNLPAKEERKLEPDINLHEIAEKYELSGGAILNAVRYASLRAIANGGRITARILKEGIRREFGKEGRSF